MRSLYSRGRELRSSVLRGILIINSDSDEDRFVYIRANKGGRTDICAAKVISCISNSVYFPTFLVAACNKFEQNYTSRYM